MNSDYTGCYANGPASVALLSSPQGLAVIPGDSSVFIADTYNNRIRQMSCIAGERAIETPTESFAHLT